MKLSNMKISRKVHISNFLMLLIASLFVIMGISLITDLTLNQRKLIEIHDKIAEIEKQVFEMTGESISQSDKFIMAMSERLADPVARKSVTQLERMVIAGANMNNAANYRIQYLFLKMKENISYKDELLTGIASAVENADRDIPRLAGTPFAPLPVMAKEINLKVKALVENQFLTEYNRMIEITGTGRNEAEALNNTLRNRIAFIIFSFAGVMLLVALSAFIIQLRIAKTITAPLKDVVSIAGEIADGELNPEIGQIAKEETGEMKLNLIKMVEVLKKIVESITGQSAQIHAVTRDLNDTAQSLSDGASTQASSTEEVSASMEEMISSIENNAQNAQTSKEIATQVSGDAAESRRVMQEALSKIDEIASMITVVEEIAGQTNMLALNAAIEAARAGESGKGFSVVAAEVRKLAERSQSAAGKISQMSESTRHTTIETNEILNRMFERINETLNISLEIADSSAEQRSGSSQINNAIQSLDEVTQQNAAIAEELSASSENLMTLVDSMQEVITFFKI